MSEGAKRRCFVIRIALEERAPLVLAFHEEHLTEHLWPRTLAEFRDLSLNECLYEVVETTPGGEQIVGLCYVMRGSEPSPPHAKRDEFGGIYVRETCRGLGLASALGIVAIANHVVWDPPQGRLVAHVHEANTLPRGMLENQLGFVRDGEESPPADVAPASMPRNEHGQVVGHLFTFDRSKLKGFAEWLGTFNGAIDGKSGASSLEVALPLMRDDLREQALTALRDLAKR